MINTSLYFLGGKICSLYLPENTAFSQEILNSILALTGNEKNCDSLCATTACYHSDEQEAQTIRK